MIQRGVEAYLSNLLTGLNVHTNLLRLIRDGGGWGMGAYVIPPTRYTVTTRMTLHYGGQLCETFYCFIFIKWAKSQDSVHTLQLWKRVESRS